MTISEIELDKTELHWDHDLACELADAIVDFVDGEGTDLTVALACLMASATFVHCSDMRIGKAASLLRGFTKNYAESEHNHNSDKH